MDTSRRDSKLTKTAAAVAILTAAAWTGLPVAQAQGSDTDGDGLSNSAELANGTNKYLADTDGDGLSDGQEVTDGTDPLVAEPETQLVTYTVSGTKAEGDRVSVAWVDASGNVRQQNNVYIPWTMTVESTGAAPAFFVEAGGNDPGTTLSCSIATDGSIWSADVSNGLYVVCR